MRSGTAALSLAIAATLKGRSICAAKLTQIGNSVVVILPKDVLARLKLAKGDTVFVAGAPGEVVLTPWSPEFDAQRVAARALMKKRLNVLRELAK